MNLRPLAHDPDELPDCSLPQGRNALQCSGPSRSGPRDVGLPALVRVVRLAHGDPEETLAADFVIVVGNDVEAVRAKQGVEVFDAVVAVEEPLAHEFLVAVEAIRAGPVAGGSR